MIEREIRYIAFEDERRNKAQQVEYKDFYRFLTPTLKHRPARDISNSKPVKSATVNDAISPWLDLVHIQEARDCETS